MAPSSNPLTGFGLPLKEPRLYDVLQAWKTQLLVGLNCAKVGRVQAFHASTRSADVELLLKRVLKDGSVADYPKLLSCPVFTLQGGGASVQLPVAAGDACLVLFSDRNLDAWYQNGTAQPPLDGRLHDLSDGVALVGLNWSADPSLPAPSTSEARLILADGLTKVGLESGKITLQNATQSLKTILDTMLTAMGAATTVGQIASAANTAKTALDLLLY